MVGIRSFPIGKAYFQGFLLLVSGRVYIHLHCSGFGKDLPRGISPHDATKELTSDGYALVIPKAWDLGDDEKT